MGWTDATEVNTTSKVGKFGDFLAISGISWMVAFL